VLPVAAGRCRLPTVVDGCLFDAITCYNVCMGKLLTRKRLQIWIACFAIFINALAPSISHALSAPVGLSGMMEICSASGTKWISSNVVGAPVTYEQATYEQATYEQATYEQATYEQATDAQSSSPLLHLEHCPFCITHAGTFALPPSSSMSIAAIVGHDLFPALFYHSPSPLFSWSAARPRGPPVPC
jgi:hypothetical protein